MQHHELGWRALDWGFGNGMKGLDNNECVHLQGDVEMEIKCRKMCVCVCVCVSVVISLYCWLLVTTMANTSFCCQKFMYVSSHLNVCVYVCERERENFCSFIRNLHSQQTNKRTPLNRFLLQKLTLSQLSRYSPHFIAPVSSSKHFKCPATCPCSEQNEGFTIVLFRDLLQHYPWPKPKSALYLPLAKSHV